MTDFTAMLGQILWLIAIDAIFLAVLFAVVVLPLAKWGRVALAVLKRNFIGYFSNPTGYVFLLLFVFLTSAFAFCVHKFFSSNLANLDQLNSVVPYIMLGFIPTITMSIWAEERRQGTDELLLTLPAGDFDIVVGKYLAAAAIFTVSLIFSQLSSYAVLVSMTLGEVDSGLLFTTYLGYWFMGLAMLSVGMVASFLTNNLTVGFVLGALFNVPLVFAKTADMVVAKANIASMVSRWSVAEQFDDFGRGVISLASSAYFILIAVLGIYLSIVLIGRRHWFNSSEGQSKWRVLGYSLVSLVSAFSILALLLYAWSGSDALGTSDAFARFGFAAVVAILAGLAIGLTSVSLVSVIIGFKNREWIRRNMFDQYVVRAMSLIALVFGLTYALANYDYVRLDMTKGKVSSLSPETVKLVQDLDDIEYPIVIDAYIGAQLPERYAKTEYNLRSLLKEFERLAGTGIQVNIYENLDRSSEEAREAEAQYGITPKRIQYLAKGAIRDEQVILGVGFRCGLEKVSVPFLDYGIPVEYELVRSLTTVAKAEREHRKKVFVVSTDAQMTGGFTMAMMQPQQIPEQAIIGELKKQYNVEQVDLTEPFDLTKVRKGDVLLAVQPSSLSPQQLSNLVDAVKKGVPTAIFEDPATYFMSHVPGTMEPKRPAGGMFGGQQPPPPKGDIHLLWKAIGVNGLGADSSGAMSQFSPPIDVVWQRYQPYKSLRLEQLGPDFVFIRNEQPSGSDAKPAFNPDEPVVATIGEILFPVPGGVIRASDASGFEFTELIRTGNRTAGRWTAADVQASRMDQNPDESKRGEPTNKQYVIAAEIKGKSTAASDKDDAKEEKNKEADKAKADEEKSDAGKTKSGDKKEKDEKKRDDAFVPGPVHVIYTADIDFLASIFLELRANPNNEMLADVNFNFENVSYVLNTIDHLSGDDRFLAIRTRKFTHPTLRAVEVQTEAASANTHDQIRKFQADLKSETERIDKERDAAIKKTIDELEAAQKKGDYAEIQRLMQKRTFEEETEKKKAEATKRNLTREITQNINEIQRRNEQEVQRIQNTFKAWALLLPLVPPLLLGLVVFARRRVKEREGISKERMR